jgi:hypothetical protein
MTDEPDPLRGKGSGPVWVVIAVVIALLSCGGAWLAVAVILNYVATAGGLRVAG